MVDDEFHDFARRMRSDRAYKDTIAKVASLSLTGTASLVGGNASKTLAAIDTGLKGANAAVDLSVFRDYAPELLVNSMEARRAEVANEIFDGMAKGADQYPLHAGIRDVVSYFNQGSVTAALSALVADTADKAKKAKTKAETAKKLIQ